MKIKYLLFCAIFLSINVTTVYEASAEDDLLSIFGVDEVTEVEEKPKVLVKKQVKKKKVRRLNTLAKIVVRNIPVLNAEQNIFVSFINKNNFEKSLYQWWAAFQDTNFGDSATGRALFSYLMFRNNLPINGVERLFQVKDPQNIDPALKKIWKKTAHKKHRVWNFAKIYWSGGWTPIFGRDIQVQVVSRQTFDPKRIDHLKSLLRYAKKDANEWAWLKWQLALGYSLRGNTKRAARMLASLLKSKQTAVNKDLIQLTAARLLYQRGFLQPAANYYSKVPKSSEFWFVAQEELAWAYLRKGEPQNSLAVTKTLMAPPFYAHVGPEAVFLDSLSNLKVCDYPEVAISIDTFKKAF